MQAPHSLMDVDFRRPSGCNFEFVRVRDVIALIARPPFAHAYFGGLAMQSPDEFDEIQETDRISEAATDIERLPGKRVNIRFREQEGIRQIFDEQQVANLHAVA